MKLHDLFETPIQTFKTIGDFSRNSSFRKQRDRLLVTVPGSVQRIKEKFENTHFDFHLYFVNSAKANKFTEEGPRDIEWVREYLGEEVADEVGQADATAITVIFTNNKGAEGMPMTSWIIAHRIAHVLARGELNGDRNEAWFKARDTLIEATDYIFNSAYRHEMETGPRNPGGYELGSRANQLRYMNFWQQVGTFKSARDANIRDWFEVLNELFAQYLTTGTLKFNPLPRVINGKYPMHMRGGEFEQREAQLKLDATVGTLTRDFDGALVVATGKIWVM